MQHRRLGASGLKISEIVFGTWLPDNSRDREESATACIHAALDAGITSFDTADTYSSGWSEEVLGRALRGQRRDGLEIMTKVFFPMGPGVNDRGLSRKHILAAVDDSLRRLGTDHIDLYQAHRFDHETPLEETMVAFADVVRAGKARYIGVSWWNADQLREGAAIARDLRTPIICHQPQYSMLFRAIEPHVVPACRDLGIDQVVWGPLAEGILTGKYAPGTRPPAGTRAADPASRHGFLNLMFTDPVLTRVQRLTAVADEAGLSMAQLALAWVLSRPGVAAAVAGASRPDQVAHNAAASGHRLTPEVMAEIDRILADVVILDESLIESPLERP